MFRPVEKRAQKERRIEGNLTFGDIPIMINIYLLICFFRIAGCVYASEIETTLHDVWEMQCRCLPSQCKAQNQCFKFSMTEGQNGRTFCRRVKEIGQPKHDHRSQESKKQGGITKLHKFGEVTGHRKVRMDLKKSQLGEKRRESDTHTKRASVKDLNRNTTTTDPCIRRGRKHQHRTVLNSTFITADHSKNNGTRSTKKTKRKNPSKKCPFTQAIRWKHRTFTICEDLNKTQRVSVIRTNPPFKSGAKRITVLRYQLPVYVHDFEVHECQLYVVGFTKGSKASRLYILKLQKTGVFRPRRIGNTQMLSIAMDMGSNLVFLVEKSKTNYFLKTLRTTGKHFHRSKAHIRVQSDVTSLTVDNNSKKLFLVKPGNLMVFKYSVKGLIQYSRLLKTLIKKHHCYLGFSHVSQMFVMCNKRNVYVWKVDGSCYKISLRKRCTSLAVSMGTQFVVGSGSVSFGSVNKRQILNTVKLRHGVGAKVILLPQG